MNQRRESDTDEPTPAQVEALLAFIAERGRRWKQELRIAWENGEACIGGEASPELQQVRNRLGPVWLHRVTTAHIQQLKIG